jgi:hypothetical protein
MAKSSFLKMAGISLAIALVLTSLTGCDDGNSTPSSKPKPSSSDEENEESESDSSEETAIEEIITPEWLQGSWFVTGNLGGFYIFEVKVTQSEIILVSPYEIYTTVSPITRVFNRPRTSSSDKPSINFYFKPSINFYSTPYSDEACLRATYNYLLEEGFSLTLYMNSDYNVKLYKEAAVKTFPESLWGKWEYSHFDYTGSYDHRDSRTYNVWSERFEITETEFIDHIGDDYSTYSTIIADVVRDPPIYSTTGPDFYEPFSWHILLIGNDGGIGYTLTLHFGEFAWLDQFNGSGGTERISIRKSNIQE